MEKAYFFKVVDRIFVSFIACLVLIFTLVNDSSCESVRGVTDKTIKIACVADQTGPIADVGIMLGEAPKHYIRYINENGGINGRTVTYYLQDDRYSIPVGIAAFKKLLFRDEIFAIMGPYNTGTIKALFRKIEKYKLPNVFMAPQPIAVNPLRKYIFVTGEFYDDDFGVLFQYFMEELRPNDPKLAFCTYEGESGREVLQSVKKWARSYNLKIHREIIPLGAMEAASQVLRMKRKGITHVLVHHSAPGAAVLLRELKKFGLSLPVLSDLLSCTEDTIKLAGAAAKDFTGAHGFSSWYDDTPGMKNVRETTLKYSPGTDTPWRTKSYMGSWVATMLLCEGMARAGDSLTPDSCITALESIKDYDTLGICGPITFSPTRHKGMNSVKLFKGDPSSGKLVPISDWRNPPE